MCMEYTTEYNLGLDEVGVPRNDSMEFRQCEAGAETAIALAIMKNSLCIFSSVLIFLSDKVQEKIIF